MGKSTGCMGWQLCALGQALICWDFRTSISLLLLLLFISAVIHSQKWWNSNSSSWPPLCISDVSSFGEGQLSKSGRRTGSICSVIYCSKLSLFYFIGLFCVLVLLLKSKSQKQSLWNLLKFTSLLLLMILRSESWTEKAESSRWAYFLILFSLFLLLLLASCHHNGSQLGCKGSQPCLETGTWGAIKPAFIGGWEESSESVVSLLHQHHHPVLLPLIFFPPILIEMLQGFSGLSVWLQELGVKCLLSMQFYKTRGKQVWQVWLSYYHFPYHKTRRLA